jgi:hypothetical protein
MRKGTNKGAVNTPCEKLIEKTKKTCFIQPAIKKEIAMGHKGYTHKLLGVPEDFNLSDAETLLQKVVDTPIGKKFKNPLKIGKRTYLVTTELKRHVNFALNLIRIAEKRKVK